MINTSNPLFLLLLIVIYGCSEKELPSIPMEDIRKNSVFTVWMVSDPSPQIAYDLSWGRVPIATVGQKLLFLIESNRPQMKLSSLSHYIQGRRIRIFNDEHSSSFDDLPFAIGQKDLQIATILSKELEEGVYQISFDLADLQMNGTLTIEEGKAILDLQAPGNVSLSNNIDCFIPENILVCQVSNHSDEQSNLELDIQARLEGAGLTPIDEINQMLAGCAFENSFYESRMRVSSNPTGDLIVFRINDTPFESMVEALDAIVSQDHLSSMNSVKFTCYTGYGEWLRVNVDPSSPSYSNDEMFKKSSPANRSLF